MEKPSMLSLVLRKLTSEKKEVPKDDAPSGNPELEQAMSDFASATTASERADAFKAALELVK